MTADEKKPHSAARDSPSPTPSNSTAPLLVSQDFNSSSDEGGTTSDWSSPSSNEDNGSDEEEEEEEGFDLLASQELRQLPSDSSTNSNHSSTAEVEEEPRMSLSFPDPINTTTTAAFSLPTTMDDSEEEVVTTSSSSSTRARSPFQKVCQDLDNSILIDGGGYSLLLDAPTKHPVGITSDSEAEAGEKEEETTSTPPPPPLLPPQLSSSRPSYSKSNTPTSSIVRVNKRSNSNHAVAAEEKIDKWRSTLTTSPRTQDSSNSIIISESIDFSSVNSSQTVVPLSNTPLARSLLSTTTTTSSASSVVVNSTTSSTLSNPTDEKKKGRNFDENHSRKALDRISGEQNGGEIKVWWWWWNRLMVGLTVLGVALAGVGTLRIWRNNQDLTRRILQQTDQENKNTCSRSIPLVQVVDHEVTEMESVVSVKVKPGATASPTNSFVDDNDSLPPSSSSLDTSAHSSPSLPTTIGPLTLATSSSPSSSSSSSLPPARIDAPPPPSLYMIDPPFSLISPSSSSSFERSTISIKEKMLNHAMRCRRGGVQQQQQQQQVESSIFDETIRLLQIGVGSSSSKVSKRGGIRKRIRTRKIEKNLKENLLQENEVEEEKKGIESRKKRVRRRRSRKPRTILKFRPYSTSSSSSSFEDCKAQERVVGIMGLEFKETLKGAMKYFRGLENKFEKEIKTLVHQAQQSLEKSSSSTLHHQKLRLYRSEKYPIVRDYYRSAKEQVKSTIGNKGKTIRQARKGIERVKDFNYKGKTQAMVALMKNQAQLMRKRSGTEIERAQLKKKWREVFTRGEKHVKRAARAVKKIEKKDYWQKLSRASDSSLISSLSVSTSSPPPTMSGNEISSVSPGDKYIGLALAISSSIAIGTSFIITKKGLISAADQSDGFSSDSYSYLKNGLWWAGMLTMVVGEVANFAAYTFAPPVLVTPLGALSVLIGAVLAAFFLGERLGPIGISGCSLCLVGSLIIVLHAPEDKEIATVDEILDYALQPGFMFYCLVVLCYSLYAIYRIAPKHGTSNPLVYISICSLVGSVSVMAVKGFGVALKLTFAGNNQLWRAGTWIFAVTVVGCIAVQMNYFNKALDLFPTTVVNPSYFVGFSSCTLLASIILFHGLNTTGGANTLSLLCGLFVICLGVYLLNLSRSENESSAHHIHRSLSHSLSGHSSSAGMRHSLSNGGGRLSMQSEGDESRRSTNLYRSGGLIGGGVPSTEPGTLFDYHGGEDLHLQKFTLREESDEDDFADERRGLRTSR